MCVLSKSIATLFCVLFTGLNNAIAYQIWQTLGMSIVSSQSCRPKRLLPQFLLYLLLISLYILVYSRVNPCRYLYILYIFAYPCITQSEIGDRYRETVSSATKRCGNIKHPEEACPMSTYWLDIYSDFIVSKFDIFSYSCTKILRPVCPPPLLHRDPTLLEHPRTLS